MLISYFILLFFQSDTIEVQQMKAQNKEEKLAKQQVCVFDNIFQILNFTKKLNLIFFLFLHFSGEGKITT